MEKVNTKFIYVSIDLNEDNQGDFYCLSIMSNFKRKCQVLFHYSQSLQYSHHQVIFSIRRGDRPSLAECYLESDVKCSRHPLYDVDPVTS